MFYYYECNITVDWFYIGLRTVSVWWDLLQAWYMPFLMKSKRKIVTYISCSANMWLNSS